MRPTPFYALRGFNERGAEVTRTEIERIERHPKGWRADYCKVTLMGGTYAAIPKRRLRANVVKLERDQFIVTISQ